jgi:acetyl-CoA/propionyl-CoA carboxylase biotin carboxyl carrier protein
VNGRLFRVRVFADEAFGGARSGGTRAPKRRGKGGGERRAGISEGTVAAPMQGTIVKVFVEAGQEVEADDPVCLLEAMKMESEIRTRTAGKVAEVLVKSGQTVRSGDPLVVLE